MPSQALYMTLGGGASWPEPNRPAIPEGYGYDYVNLEVLLERMTVNEGRLELPGGASYRLLVLPATTSRLSLPLLRKLRDLVAAGGHVIAAQPTGAPGLLEGQDYAAIVADLWGDTDGRTVTGHAHGEGKVYWGAEVALATPGGNLRTPPSAYDGRYRRWSSCCTFAGTPPPDRRCARSS